MSDSLLEFLHRLGNDPAAFAPPATRPSMSLAAQNGRLQGAIKVAKRLLEMGQPDAALRALVDVDQRTEAQNALDNSRHTQRIAP